MATPIKIAATIISVGGVAVGSGFGIHHLTKEKTVQTKVNSDDNKVSQESDAVSNEPVAISSLLAQDELKLLGSEDGDDQKWSESWRKFKEAHESKEPKEPWNFTNWEGDKAADGVASEFKTRCSENSKKSVPNKNDDLYTNLKKYCTKSTKG